MRVPNYVPESPELIRARSWEENTRWRTTVEAGAEALDHMKDWTICGKRCGVPESFSHSYDAEVAA